MKFQYCWKKDNFIVLNKERDDAFLWFLIWKRQINDTSNSYNDWYFWGEGRSSFIILTLNVVVWWCWIILCGDPLLPLQQHRNNTTLLVICQISHLLKCTRLSFYFTVSFSLQYCSIAFEVTVSWSSVNKNECAHFTTWVASMKSYKSIHEKMSFDVGKMAVSTRTLIKLIL